MLAGIEEQDTMITWQRSRGFWRERRIWRAVQELLKSDPGVRQWGVETRGRLFWRRAWLYTDCVSPLVCELLYDDLIALGLRQISFRAPCSLWVMPSLD
jgi:hypothetical protein